MISQTMSAEKGKRIADRGVSFRVATKEDREGVWKLLSEHFLDGEPIFRSLGAARNKTFVDKWSRSIFKDMALGNGFKKPKTSIVAVNEQGEIIGAKLGYYKTPEDPKTKMTAPWLEKFSWMMPKQVTQLMAAQDLSYNKVRYDAHLAMEDLGATSVFVGDVMSVSSDYQGLGLGTEMDKLSIELAKKHGCSHYMVSVSSKYSQAIYYKLGFDVTHRVFYEQERDRNGNLVVDQPGEHEKWERVVRKVDV